MLTPKCPKCGTKMKREVGRYNVGDLLGLPSVEVKGLPAFVCPNQDEIVFRGKDLQAIIAHLTMTMVREVDRLGGVEVRYLRKQLGESQKQFATRMGTTVVTVASWESSNEELEPALSYAIRSVVARVLDIDIDPYILRKGHERPSNYRFDMKAARAKRRPTRSHRRGASGSTRDAK